MANALSISGSETAAELQAKIDSGDTYNLAAAAVACFVTRFIDGELTVAELEQIGDLLEGAEFFEYVGPGADGLIAQVVYEMSTPKSRGTLTKDAAQRWLQLLG